MQFIENSDFGVRAAIYYLTRTNYPLRFVLFPMIHIGSMEYYDAVSRGLAQCDYILAEGVTSRKGRIITLSYRVVAKIKRFDLVTQHVLDNYMKALGPKVVNVDMARAYFDERWNRIPLRERLLLYVAVPAFVLFMFFFGTKRLIGKFAETNDLPSREEMLLEQTSGFENISHLIGDERDARLVQEIRQFYMDHESEEGVVGIIYGAHHMRVISRLLLRKLKYHVAGAEWITVFDY